MSNPLSKEYTQPYSPQDYFDLNWSDPYELLTFIRAFSFNQQNLLKLIRKKQFRYGMPFKRGNYFESIYPLIASGHPMGVRMAYCGKKQHWGGTCCERWKLCSRCAFIRKLKTLESYLPSFHTGRFMSATISFNGDIPQGIPMGNTMNDTWNAIHDSIKRLRASGIILGGYYVNELSIRKFLPLTVLPHMHCVFHVDEPSPAVRKDLLELLNEFRNEGMYPLSLVPSVMTESVESLWHFGNVLGYPTKAIDLVGPYQNGVEKILNGMATFPKLNFEFCHFLYAWLGAIYRRTAIHRIGTMHHASGDFIGTRKEDKEDAHEFVRDCLQNWGEEIDEAY